MNWKTSIRISLLAKPRASSFFSRQQNPNRIRGHISSQMEKGNSLTILRRCIPCCITARVFAVIASAGSPDWARCRGRWLGACTQETWRACSGSAVVVGFPSVLERPSVLNLRFGGAYTCPYVHGERSEWDVLCTFVCFSCSPLPYRRTSGHSRNNHFRSLSGIEVSGLSNMQETNHGTTV